MPMNRASLVNRTSALLFGGASLLLASCAVTQESRMNIKIPSSLCSDLSSTAMEKLQMEGEKACRKAGYSNFSSNILIFSTNVNYLFTEADLDIAPAGKKRKATGNGPEAPNVRIKGKMTVSRTRNYEIPGIIFPLLYWTGGTVYVEFPVDVLYYEPDPSFRKTL